MYPSRLAVRIILIFFIEDSIEKKPLIFITSPIFLN